LTPICNETVVAPLRVMPLAVDSSGNRIPVRQLPDPRDLLVHCAQEMNHLAGFLPALHECFGQ